MGPLFLLSLTPAATAWLGPHTRDSAPVVMYGVVLFGSAVADLVLVRALLALHRRDSSLAVAIDRYRKGRLSAVAHLVAIERATLESWMGHSWGAY